MVNHEKIRKDLQNITSFINKYNWEGIHVPSENDNWKKFEKNVTIALNVLHAKKEKNISCLCFKKYLKSWKTSYSFIDCKWKGMVLSCREKISALLRGINSKHYGGFYCLICFLSFRTKTDLKA